MQELTKENLQELVYQKPAHILVHFPGKDGKPHAQWKECQKKFRKMFEYYETETLAADLGVKQTPAIVYFPKSLVKKNVQKTVFYSQASVREIYDEI